MLDSFMSEWNGLSRRELLMRGGGAAAGSVGLAVLMWGRKAVATDRLERQLLETAAPLTTKTAHAELLELPVRARESIRLFFDGVCLDVHAFTAEVCSQRFVERLGATGSAEQRRDLVAVAFERRVVAAAEILNRVGVIAEELGTELDRNWAACCTEIAADWGVPLGKYAGAPTPGGLATAVAPLIRERLQQTLERVTTETYRPAFSGVPSRVGQSALLLLPLTPFAPKVVLPLFVAVALTHVVSPVIAWLLQPGRGELQRAVSGRMALLGNQVGAEFEREIRRRIADLHNWRDQSLQAVARKTAEDSVGWL